MPSASQAAIGIFCMMELRESQDENSSGRGKISRECRQRLLNALSCVIFVFDGDVNKHWAPTQSAWVAYCKCTDLPFASSIAIYR